MRNFLVMSATYVCYYRVSTEKQDLGIPAQRTACKKYVQTKGGRIVAEFEEHISGASRSRPELQKALRFAKDGKHTLVVAKLDRLSRNVYTIMKLREDKDVDIVVVENPTMFKDTLLLSVYAGIAQKEREMISQRTKDALAELKKKGVKLGNPNGFSKHCRDCGLAYRRQKSKDSHAVFDNQIWALHRKV